MNTWIPKGVIPRGQYGGGTVMVWGIGTYEIVEGNYWKGNLHISLKGKKLKGEWMLARDRAKRETERVLEKLGAARSRFRLDRTTSLQ